MYRELIEGAAFLPRRSSRTSTRRPASTRGASGGSSPRATSAGRHRSWARRRRRSWSIFWIIRTAGTATRRADCSINASRTARRSRSSWNTWQRLPRRHRGGCTHCTLWRRWPGPATSSLRRRSRTASPEFANMRSGSVRRRQRTLRPRKPARWCAKIFRLMTSGISGLTPTSGCEFNWRTHSATSRSSPLNRAASRTTKALVFVQLAPQGRGRSVDAARDPGRHGAGASRGGVRQSGNVAVFPHPAGRAGIHHRGRRTGRGGGKWNQRPDHSGDDRHARPRLRATARTQCLLEPCCASFAPVALGRRRPSSTT